MPTARSAAANHRSPPSGQLDAAPAGRVDVAVRHCRSPAEQSCVIGRAGRHGGLERAQLRHRRPAPPARPSGSAAGTQRLQPCRSRWGRSGARPIRRPPVRPPDPAAAAGSASPKVLAMWYWSTTGFRRANPSFMAFAERVRPDPWEPAGSVPPGTRSDQRTGDRKSGTAGRAPDATEQDEHGGRHVVVALVDRARIHPGLVAGEPRRLGRRDDRRAGWAPRHRLDAGSRRRALRMPA